MVKARYDGGGFSGGSTDRPTLQRFLADVMARRIHIIVVYEVDRLTRSLADFAKLVELFDAHGVSFVSGRRHGSARLHPQGWSASHSRGEANIVRLIFQRYLELGSVNRLGQGSEGAGL
ncbi:recombinase family protein [Nitrobacter sp. TKz-YC02]|uniref:recombinase family protein n=1 Tax=Nitrobacter sp. TKz-YC02 TaxID=3398704 RepID=UPI003CF260F8